MNTYKRIIATVLALAMVVPSVVFASPNINLGVNIGICLIGNCSNAGNGTISGELMVVYNIIQMLIIMSIGLAILFFLYGVLAYVTAGDSEEKRKKGRDRMIYGIIGIFVMVSVWGLVNILINTFGLGGLNSSIPPPPVLPGIP